MLNVTIYTKKFCPFCVRAKQLFDQLGVSYEEIDVRQHPEKRVEAQKKYNWPTVPMIVINGEFIGGSDELYQLYDSGELAKKLSLAKNA